jgi:hypothetical protein
MKKVTLMEPLPDDSQRVLRVMLDRPVLAGTELLILTGLDEEKLYKALQSLIGAGLVSASAFSSDPTELLKAYFNLKPSARRYAEFAAR